MANIDFEALNALLGSVDFDKITADSDGSYDELPDGYYLSEVESAELTTGKTSGNPMVSFRFKVVEDGIGSYVDDKGYMKLKNLENTKNRKIFKYYPLVNEKNVNSFVSDMLKFEGETAGEPILPKEAFTSGEVLEEALDVLTGSRIYIQVSTTVKKSTGEASKWNNLVSWKRAESLGLPD